MNEAHAAAVAGPLPPFAEALFISAVRAYLQDDEGPRRGVLAAIGGRAWTVEELARSARMSRSAFAARFARRSAKRRSNAIAEVAGLVGYDSSISITRAFGRVIGQTPGAYKRVPKPSV